MSIVINKERLHKVCKVGQGNITCRYIVAGNDGITCAKHQPPFNKTIDERVAARLFVARGDNCDGLKIVGGKIINEGIPNT